MSRLTKEDRAQKIIVLVEKTLDEIAREHTSPFTMAPAMVEFFGELQRRLMKVSSARLMTFLSRKEPSQ